METNIYFIRHAHSIYTSDELNRPLSNKGHCDALQVTNALTKERIDYVLSSPFKRAVQTVEGIATFHNKKIIIDERFKERLLSNSPIDNFEEMVFKSWQNFNFSLIGGESNNNAQARGVQGIEDILSKYQSKNIVIGTHGNIMVLTMNYYDEKYDYLFWRNLDMPAIYKLSFDNKVLK